MCGDVAEGIELAVGNARSPDDIDHDTSPALDEAHGVEDGRVEPTRR